MKHKSNRNSFFDNWQAKILCLILAVLIFFSFSYGIPGERRITLPLSVILPNNLKVTSIIPTSADIVITGNDEQIYMIDVSKLKLYADFSGVKDTGVASVAVSVDYAEMLDYIGTSGVTVSVDPSIVKLYFEKI